MGRKREGHQGFSLIELIVVIAIMAVLVGVTVPQFFRYVNKNRGKACTADREGILAVYERCVYNGELEVEQSDIDMLLAHTYTDTSVNEEVKGYMCPEGGTYSATVTGNVVRLACSCGTHDDVVAVDFTGMSGTEEAETDDNPFPTPIPMPTTAPMPTAAPSPTAAPTPTGSVIDSIWPYSYKEIWGDNPQPGQSVTLSVPTIIFMSEQGNEFTIVDQNNNGTYVLHYEKSMSPEYANSIDPEKVVLYSGVTITDVDSLRVSPGSNQITGVSYGDIIVYNGKKYIYASKGDQSGIQNLPTRNGDGNFYLVGE